MNEEIRNKLFTLQDVAYQQFQSKLCPNVDNMIGVRLPQIRNIAKEITKKDFRAYLNHAWNDYYEEIMLQGLVIGNAKMDVDEMFLYIRDFIPKINNWAVCDSFCAGLKITKTHMREMWDFLKLYFNSNQEFELRFAIVMILNYYITDNYIDYIFILTETITHDGYYVKMGIAWLLSVCFIKYPEKTMDYLSHSQLENFTYNKCLQKIVESSRVNVETKQTIYNMKRK